MNVRDGGGETSGPGIELVAVGDVMPGDSAICVGWGMASRWPGRAFGKVLEATAPLLSGGDVLFGNLEAPLTRNGVGGTRWSRDQMRATPEVAAALADAGFTVMSVANNHAEQHGKEGFASTVAALRSVGIAVIGLRGASPWASEPAVLEVRGRKVGLLAYCWRPRQYGSGTPDFAEGDPEAAAEDVRRLAEECDTVVVSLHWGEEFLGEPSRHEVETAELLLESGASVILGHHPHVLRPVRRTERGVVAYSLGNFASDMAWMPEMKVGAVLRCRVDGRKVTSVSTARVRMAPDFRTVPESGDLPALDGSGLSPDVYEREVGRSVQRQRVRSYAYALTHVTRYPPSVLAELLGRTARNRIAAVLARGRR